MSERYAAFGAQLQRGDGADPEVFSTVAGVYDITPPPLSADTSDVTAHDSPARFEEHVKTILRSGEPTFSLRFDPGDTDHQQLLADYKDTSAHTFKVIFPDTDDSECTFSALVTGYAPTAPHDEFLGVEVTMKPTGEVTFSWES